MTGAPAFDPAARYVRIMRERADGMVAFKFAVGEPALFVEMVMQDGAFHTESLFKIFSGPRRYLFGMGWLPPGRLRGVQGTGHFWQLFQARDEPRARQRRGRSGRLRAIVSHPADQRSAPENVFAISARDVRDADWDGLQGANRSHSRSYGEDLQRRRPPKSAPARPCRDRKHVLRVIGPMRKNVCRTVEPAGVSFVHST